MVDDGYKDDAVEKLGCHKPAGPLRGGKYSNFEGGTRVPLIVRWPDHVAAGTSAALVCHIDLMASLAKMTGTSLAPADVYDSTDVLSALLGKSRAGRTELVEEAGALSLRQGDWKYIEPNSKQKINQQTNTELGNDSVAQLYDLSKDPGETRNLAATNPERVIAMRAALEQIRKIADRVTPLVLPESAGHELPVRWRRCLPWRSASDHRACDHKSGHCHPDRLAVTRCLPRAVTVFPGRYWNGALVRKEAVKEQSAPQSIAASGRSTRLPYACSVRRW